MTREQSRLCSVCAPLRAARKHRVKTRYSQSPERGVRKRNVLCFQFTVVFPSWTWQLRKHLAETDSRLAFVDPHHPTVGEQRKARGVERYRRHCATVPSPTSL